MVFMKNPASVIGDGESIVIPEVCRFPRPQVDWEAELGVVVGRDVRDLGVEEAMDWVRDRGVERVEIQVASGNPEGQAFWRALGYADLMSVLHKRLESR